MARVGVFHADIGTFAFEVGPRPVVVGRPGGGAQLEMTWDALVSRAHGQFWQQGAELWYADLGSKNGSWMAGQRITGGVRLTMGSSLTLGTTIFTVIEDASAFAPTASAFAPAQPFGGPTSGAPVLGMPSPQYAPQPQAYGQQALGPAQGYAQPLGAPTQQYPGQSPGASAVFGQPTAVAPRSAQSPGASLFGPNAANVSAPAAPAAPPTPEKKKGQWADSGVNTELFSSPLDPAAISRVAAEMFPNRSEPPRPLEQLLGPDTLAELVSTSTNTELAKSDSGQPTQRAEPPKAAPADLRQPYSISLVSADRVEVRAASRDAIVKLWAQQLSKGGLFVACANPPPAGRRLEVVFSTPDGELATRAEAVHVLSAEMAAKMGQQPGAGLQISESWAREAIRRYAEGIDMTLVGGRADRAGAKSSAAMAEVFALARDVLAKCEQNKLYEAIGVPYTARADEIKTRVQALAMKLGVSLHEASPAQAARVETAKKVLGRLLTMLTDPIRRAEHDFKMGFSRIPERIRMAASGDGPSERELREAWHRIFPEHAEKSRQATKRAIQSAQRARFDEAVKAAKEALDVDPFHEELRKSLSSWETMAQKPMPR
ncbi:MAG: FHA domain-containing protein [Deltaproteobacteria bacterium]|nr:FHA domain-containing protein [Deltaproteobacteria bacterium]